MTILQVLKQEHAEVKKLLKNAEKTGSAAGKTRKALFAEIYTQLMLHAKAEDKVLYTRLREKKLTKEITLEAKEEHVVAEFVLKSLNGLDPKHEAWKGKIMVLRENVEHHIREEEQEMFPKVKELFTTLELQEMAEEYLEEKGNIRI